MISYINRESKVATSVEGGVLSVDENGSLVVNSIEIEQDAITIPFRWNLESCGEPRVENVLSLNACSND